MESTAWKMFGKDVREVFSRWDVAKTHTVPLQFVQYAEASQVDEILAFGAPDCAERF